MLALAIVKVYIFVIHYQQQKYTLNSNEQIMQILFDCNRVSISYSGRYLFKMKVYIFIIHYQQQKYTLNSNEQIMQNFLSGVKERLRGTVYLLILRILILSIVLTLQ